MAKIDIAHAYRNAPLHPDDCLLLGMRWQEAIYIDTMLPFGLNEEVGDKYAQLARRDRSRVLGI